MNNKPVLAFYDIIGIQQFIFSSNRLREILGASSIVAKIFDVYLIESAKKVIPDFKSNLLGEGALDLIAQKTSLIYQGGGNALVLYANLEVGKKVTQELSQRILLETGGSIHFVVAYQETSFEDYSADIAVLQRKIEEKKFSAVLSDPLLGLGITKAENSTGLPAVAIEYGEYISRTSQLKRREDKEFADHYERDLLPAGLNFMFPRELDDLGQNEGENYIAIVHIDGDDFGQKMKQLLANEKNFTEAIKKVNEFSTKITVIYKKTMVELIKKIAVVWKDFFKDKTKTAYLPFRPIVLNGDDVTFISHGKLGLGLAEQFLKIFSSMTLEVAGEPLSLSASAGVIILKSHFPFYRAYDYAESLCKHAKTKSKILYEKARADGKDIPRGCWMDFQIIQAGFRSSIEVARQSDYNIKGLSPPDPLECNLNHDSTKLTMVQQNLLVRPWCVCGDYGEDYSWDNILKVKTLLNKWPRSKRISLQKIFQSSIDQIKQYISELKSRNILLPQFGISKQPFNDSLITPYFDALEVLEFYDSDILECLKTDIGVKK
jgi:hypothetical protein